MNIQVNGKSVVTTATTVSGLVDELQLPHNGTAVAIENKLVPRDSWDSQELIEGMNIVVIRAAAGG